jgi:hypothetical protein
MLTLWIARVPVMAAILVMAVGCGSTVERPPPPPSPPLALAAGLDANHHRYEIAAQVLHDGKTAQLCLTATSVVVAPMATSSRQCYAYPLAGQAVFALARWCGGRPGGVVAGLAPADAVISLKSAGKESAARQSAVSAHGISGSRFAVPVPNQSSRLIVRTPHGPVVDEIVTGAAFSGDCSHSTHAHGTTAPVPNPSGGG